MKRYASLLLALCAVCALATAASARFNGVLYVTNFVDHKVDSVRIANGFVVAGTQGKITNLPGSDGVTCRNLNLELAVGGQLDNNVYRVNPTTGAYSNLNNSPIPGGAFIVAYNLDESVLWTTGLTNNTIAEVNYATGATTNHVVTGLDPAPNQVAGIVFDPNGKVYITDSPNTGNGSVYELNMTTFVATKVLGPIQSAHGIVYDEYLSTLLSKKVYIIDGGDYIHIYDFATTPPTLLKEIDVTALVGHPDVQAHLDLGWTNGKGDYFTASNAGPIIYVDLTQWPALVAELSGNTGFGTDDITGCAAAPPPPPDCDNNALSWGFWKHQCSDKGKHQVSPATMAGYFAAISASNSKVFGAGGCYKAGCDLLNAKFSSDLRSKAAQQYLALMLNFQGKLISRECVIVCDDVKYVVGDVVDEIENNLCKTGQSQSFYSHLLGIAECGNTFAEGGGGKDVTPDAAEGSIVSSRFQVQRTGTNPARLSEGGVSFRINTASGIGMVRLGIYDATGRLVATPVRDRAISGSGTATWDGTTLRGSRAAAGTYFYRATSGESVVTGRFLLLP